jgi:hypothetical protein
LPTPLDLGNVEDEVIKAMRKAGIAPEVVYACKKIGLIGVAGEIDNWPADRREEWEAAIDEYFALAENQAKCD